MSPEPKARKSKAAAQVTRYYKLDKDALDLAQRMARQRLENGWQALARIHGWSEEDIWGEEDDRFNW